MKGEEERGKGNEQEDVLKARFLACAATVRQEAWEYPMASDRDPRRSYGYSQSWDHTQPSTPPYVPSGILWLGRCSGESP